MASTTEEVMKSRIPNTAAVTPNKWCEDFEKAKAYADKNKLPFLAVWSNGEKCSHCKKFNKCILDTTFTSWQAKSGIVYWIGFGDDTYKPNRHGGEGYKFAKAGKLTTFPFVRLYWAAKKVDVAKSGDDWDGASAKGAATLIKNIETYIGNACPDCDDGAEDDTPSKPDGKPVNPPKYVLGYEKTKMSTKYYSLTVDGVVATKLSKEVAEAVVARYNGCGD